MIRTHRQSFGLVILLTLTLALLPLWIDSFYILSILTLANLYAVFVVSWDLVSGYTGKLNLGQALFIGLGTYSVGIFHDSVGITLSLLIGVLAAVLAAILIGVPSLKLNGPFFSLTTMVLPLIMHQLAYTYRDVSGGEFGLTVAVPLSRMELYYVTLGFMLVSVLFILSLTRSRIGKILLAIKEDELACSAIGNNVERYKLGAFVISAVVSGFGGGLLALYLRHVSPNVFEIWQSATILIMGLVGGMGTIIGPNGAGKTTLFHLISGIQRPSSGSVTFKGKEITGKAPHLIVREGVTRTFQVPRPFQELTVYENVEIVRPSKKSREERAERIERILQQVGLWKSHDQLAGNLPQGDLRRLELARALATNPELLFLDEPFAGLNVSEIESLSELLMQMHKDGITIIIIEHKLKELMKMVKRVLVIHFGELIADDFPQKVVHDEKVLQAYLGDRSWDFAYNN